MKILENELLSKYTTVHIGGICKKMFIPETENELISLIDAGYNIYLLGGGSNLLISDRVFDYVVNLRKFDEEIMDLGDGCFKVGASVRLQKLIKTINEKEYGGIEYLYSVPGLVGGAIVMNAGGGIEQGWSISDHVVEVRALYNGKIISLTKEDCNFAHRKSIFRDNLGYLVLSATLSFDKGELSYFESKRKDRLEYCKKYQDNGKPNFGSVFYIANGCVLGFLRRTSFGSKKGCHFSGKTSNWILNEGEGTFKQTIKLIKKAEFLHKCIGKKCEPEVEIWE